jgi:hypothetical protein
LFKQGKDFEEIAEAIKKARPEATAVAVRSKLNAMGYFRRHREGREGGVVVPVPKNGNGNHAPAPARNGAIVKATPKMDKIDNPVVLMIMPSNSVREFLGSIFG